ncbi:MAG: CPBP family intramembrane glutamic endopeptidase [Collinsella sp.]|nr:CPBP family intramembrane glutamic endopeptidase [Collinsella sp.]
MEHALVPMGILAEAYEDFSTMWNGPEEAGYSWVCLSTVAIGPIFEEVLFRGLVYSVAERGFGGYAPAILSSVLFGLWHGQPVQMIYATVIGVALGLVYMKTKNLLYPILLHMLINLYSTLPPPCIRGTFSCKPPSPCGPSSPWRPFGRVRKEHSPWAKREDMLPVAL